MYDTWYLILGTWYLILGTYYSVLWMLPTPLITECRVASSVTSHANRLLFHTRVLIAAVVVSSTMMTKNQVNEIPPNIQKVTFSLRFSSRGEPIFSNVTAAQTGFIKTIFFQ